MVTNTRNWIMAGMLGLLVACGGGGGGNSAPGVEPGPPPPGQPIPPEPIPPTPAASPYAEAEVLNAYITSATLNGDNQPVIEFQLSDGNNVAITDLTSGDVRFVIAKLETSPQGNLTGTWQSYVNVIAEPRGRSRAPSPSCRPPTSAMMAIIPGEFTNNGDGTYTYQYATSLTNLPQDILDQAAVEGLDLSYNPNLTHRVAIQFDNGARAGPTPIMTGYPPPGPPTAFSPWISPPRPTVTAATTRWPYTAAAAGKCKYCVTCHNPGSIDPEQHQYRGYEGDDPQDPHGRQPAQRAGG